MVTGGAADSATAGVATVLAAAETVAVAVAGAIAGAVATIAAAAVPAGVTGAVAVTSGEATRCPLFAQGGDSNVCMYYKITKNSPCRYLVRDSKDRIDSNGSPQHHDVNAAYVVVTITSAV